jgi:cyclic dehypoxanthinyl futalosine synthase
LSYEQIGAKIDETKALGGVQILMQGGHNPYIPFEWYLDLLRYIKRNHPIHVHGFSPSEVDFWSKLYRMEAREVIRELQKAGLDSIPGGGGEILVQRVRDDVAKKKAGAIAGSRSWRSRTRRDEDLCHDDVRHRRDARRALEHLERVKEVQKRTGGFTAFICWPLQPENTPRMSHMPKTGRGRTICAPSPFSRIVLDNVPNIQSSWVTMG